jgi:hypothetical protein
VVLLNFGIVASRGVKRARYRGKPHLAHRLVIAGAEVDRFSELIGFSVQRKCSLVPPPKRNANVDLIPYVGQQLAMAMRATVLTHAEHKAFSDYRRGSRRPSYAKLSELVARLEPRVGPRVLEDLRDILDRNFLFLDVESITPSRARVYDLTVPGTHAFIANGFVNHNSFIGVAMGVAALRDRRVSRLILTRPAVEAGERLGFLPGDLQEKIDPYLRPLYDALYELMPAERMARAQERGEIEVAPLAYMRGRAQPIRSSVLTPTGFRAMGTLASGRTGCRPPSSASTRKDANPSIEFPPRTERQRCAARIICGPSRPATTARGESRSASSRRAR